MTDINKYENLLERSVRSTEQQNIVSNSLLEVSKNLEKNVKDLNDNFILHIQQNSSTIKEVKEVRQILLKWIKWLALALFVTVGGATILRVLFDFDFSGLVK